MPEPWIGGVEVDDAYLGGEHPGGKVGRDSENKARFYYGSAEARITRVIQVGLGASEKLDMDKLCGATVIGLMKCREMKRTSVTIPLCAFEGLPLEIAPAPEEEVLASGNRSCPTLGTSPLFASFCKAFLN